MRSLEGEFTYGMGCAICGRIGSGKELATGYEITICRKCLNDFWDWKLQSEELIDFEVVHESYVMIKRRGLSIEECLNFFTDDRLRPVVDEIRNRRVNFKQAVRLWVLQQKFEHTEERQERIDAINATKETTGLSLSMED